MNLKKPFVLFIMGVSGVGKSTIGKLLSQQLSIPFFDGDDYHPEKNVKKMAQGKALTDDDRYEWLVKLNELAKEQIKQNSCIIACSALKENYRDHLKKNIEANVKWIFLNGSFDQISDRLKQRKDHFMPSSLLKSQFDVLEDPIQALNIDIANSPTKIVEHIVSELTKKTEFGVIGLGVMGKSLARNLASNHFTLSLFNRHVDNLEVDVALNFKNKFQELSSALPFDDLEAFVNSLQSPRKILLMVNAGKPIDNVIESLIPLLSENDVIIDGGNSHYNDTNRRINSLQKHRLNFIGAGVSGGEEGALKGPSFMPGGNKNAYKIVQPFLETIAAKDKNSHPCCSYIGKSGSGHFTKMVHNGIEYAEMQLLAEIYFILKISGGNPDEIANILESWKPTSNSYLLEITIEILRKKDGNDWLIDKILDTSGNKGTGNWTTIATAELGVPSTMIPSALFARYISSFKEERIEMNEVYGQKTNKINVDTNELLKAYQLARIINHHQGFKLLNQASKTYLWDLNLTEIARIWTNGCIIRSSLMEELSEMLKESDTILISKNIIPRVKELKPYLNKIVSNCILNEIPIPCLSESVNFINGYKEANSSANLIQAQRDYFGAHTYQRIDDISGKFYHTNWKIEPNH
jgi:6-phosphogluconate dehydrogenase